MNSIKNLLVVVLLMGVSYGAFQVINAPDPTLSGEVPDVEEISIDIGPALADDGPVLAENGPHMAENGPLLFDERSLNAEGQPALSNEAPMFSNESTELPPVPQGSPGFSANNQNQLPALPPGLQRAGDSSTTTDPELPELNITEAPPQSSSAFAPSTPNAAPAERKTGQFQPAPRGEMVPMSPRPLGELANQQLNQLGAAAEAQADHMMDRAGQFANEQLQPGRDGIQAVQDGMNQFSAQANQLLDGAQNRLADPSPLSADPAAISTPLATAPPAMSATANAPAVDWNGINQLASAGSVRQALEQLSRHYDSPLPADQRMQMLQWLDQLAGKVIYSTEHHLADRPYIVADGDTLESLASQWNVPSQLIYNINNSKIGDPSLLVAGTELKRVDGPFNARISVDRQEMTLFLGDLYAGRFSIALGQDHQFDYGSFLIEGKSESGRDYQDASGQVIAAGDANNPYGKFWLGFSNSNLCIHESAGDANPGDTRGCIRLSSRDAADVYGILSDGSQVSISR